MWECCPDGQWPYHFPIPLGDWCVLGWTWTREHWSCRWLGTAGTLAGQESQRKPNICWMCVSKYKSVYKLLDRGVFFFSFSFSLTSDNLDTNRKTTHSNEKIACTCKLKGKSWHAQLLLLTTRLRSGSHLFRYGFFFFPNKWEPSHTEEDNSFNWKKSMHKQKENPRKWKGKSWHAQLPLLTTRVRSRSLLFRLSWDENELYKKG